MVIVFAMLLVRSQSTVWLVYPLLLLETIMASFFEPARSAVIPNITSRDELVVANTLSSTTWSVNLVLGATLGGLVAALLGRDAVFVLNGLSFLASAFLIRGMRFQEPHADGVAGFRITELVDYSPIVEGIRYVRTQSKLLATIFVKAGMFVIGPSWVVFTVLGRRDFPVRWHDLDPQRGAMLGMSLLMGARGVGAMLGPLLGAPRVGHSERRLRLAILAGYLAEALGYAALGKAGSLWLACLFVVIAHSGGSSVWVFSTTLLQLNTDDRFRGRVFAADNGLCMLMIAIGAYLAGHFIDAGFSARVIASAAGLLMLIPAALWAWVIWSSSGQKPIAQSGGGTGEIEI
jgi:predicted MFS family arabinose efflux permease